MGARQTATFIHDASGVARRRSQPHFALRVVAGPDKKLERTFCTARVVIGTAEGADVRVKDPTVSALHCAILSDETGFRVRDLGSKNGVMLHGRRVMEAWLEDGDELALGRTIVRVVASSSQEESALSEDNSFGGLHGSSPLMRQLYQHLAKIAPTELPVLIYGATGTGKDLAAEAIIASGPRRDGPVVVVECAGLTGELADSQLFGHERGAFTGATDVSKGLFEAANGGTLVLDGVGELPLDLQPKLLGALERASIRRVGGKENIPLDVRVIATTTRDLEPEVNRGTFRSDLYFRLSVLQVRMPALGEHAEDIPELVALFLEQTPNAKSIPPAVLRHLYEREYPGNVRELRNLVERAATGIELTHTPDLPLPPMRMDVPYRQQKDDLLAAFQRRYLRELFAQCGGNVSEASRRSGIERMHLYAMMRKLGVTRD